MRVCSSCGSDMMLDMEQPQQQVFGGFQVFPSGGMQWICGSRKLCGTIRR